MGKRKKRNNTGLEKKNGVWWINKSFQGKRLRECCWTADKKEAEEVLAQHIIDSGFKKPIVGYIAGRQAPKEKRMGHAGAIVMGTYGSAESKISMFAKANIPVAKRPGEVAVLLAGKMNSQ